MNQSIAENTSVEEVIRRMENDIKEKQSVLKVLYEMVNKTPAQFSSNGSVVNNTTIEHSQPLDIDVTVPDGKMFPKGSRTDKQVMFLFDNIFERGQKYSAIQKKFNELLGAEKNVYNTLRTLKKLGYLSTVQYNKQNKLSFWGKKNWIGDHDYLDKYKPDPDEMPIDVVDTKILTDDDLLS